MPGDIFFVQHVSLEYACSGKYICLMTQLLENTGVTPVFMIDQCSPGF